MISLLIVGSIAGLAIGLALFQTWYFPMKMSEMVNLFMTREARTLDRIKKAAKKSIHRNDNNPKTSNGTVGSGNRRMRRL